MWLPFDYQTRIGLNNGPETMRFAHVKTTGFLFENYTMALDYMTFETTTYFEHN